MDSHSSIWMNGVGGIQQESVKKYGIKRKKGKKSITLKIQSYPPKMIMHKNGKNQKNAWCP